MKFKFIVFCLFSTSIFSMEGSFLGKLFKDPTTIGAVAESSDALAEEITKYFPKDSAQPVRILEVGAGTGVFTRKLAAKLRPGDRLDVIELTSEFMPKLYEEFGNDDRINIYWEDILKFQPDGLYDFIVSGLPFNSFDSETVTKMTQKYLDLSKPGTVISFFEYEVLADLRKFVGKIIANKEYEQTRTSIENFVNKYAFEKGSVLKNIPPAVVHHLLITTQD